MSSRYIVTDIIDRNCFDAAKRDLVAFRCDDESVTFAQLQDSYRRIASSLRANGVRKGDRIAFYLGNGIEWIELFFAVVSTGAVCVPINVMMRGKDIAQILGDNDFAALVVGDGSLEHVQGIGGIPPIVIHVGVAESLNAETTLRFDELKSGIQDPADRAPVVTPEDVAMMYFTSGTTGTPKAAQHTHAGIMWNTFHQVSDLEITEHERFLVVASMSWGAGLHDVTLALAWLGGENIILPTGGMMLDRLADAVERFGITRTLLVPTVLREILRRPEIASRLAASTLRRAMSGAEPLYLEVTRALQKVMPDLAITQTYGMTEFPLIATVTTAEDARNRPGTAGRASSITTLGVRTEAGEIVSNGSGEIVFRSAATSIGYHNAPEKNAEAFRDGWFHSGDLGTIDADGYLTVTGRAKDMIISGGLNIYPREIESVLSKIPGVIESAVIGRKDDRWGEIPVAIVVVDESMELTREQIIEFCKQEISSFKCPKDAIIRTAPLPKTVTGKIVKRQIEDPVAVR